MLVKSYAIFNAIKPIQQAIKAKVLNATIKNTVNGEKDILSEIPKMPLCSCVCHGKREI
jgi:hypothetical protein